MWVKKGRLPGGSVRNWLRGTEGLQRRPSAPTAHLSGCRPPISEATLRKGKRTAFRVGPRCLPYRQYDPQVPPPLRASFLPSKWGAGTYLTGYRGEHWLWRPRCAPGVLSSTCTALCARIYHARVWAT